MGGASPSSGRSSGSPNGALTPIFPAGSCSSLGSDEPAFESEQELDSPRLWKSLADMDRPAPSAWGAIDDSSPSSGPTVSHQGRQVREFLAPEPPKASDGWQVTLHD